MLCFCFFFKQKTAYEMRISDWSSDVCSSDLHPAVLAEAGEEHLHLFARGVLRFIQDDEAVSQRAPAHEGDRRDLDLARCQPPLDLFGWHAVVKRVVERAQIRSEEHTSELQSLMRISYAVFCLKKKNKTQ